MDSKKLKIANDLDSSRDILMKRLAGVNNAIALLGAVTSGIAPEITPASSIQTFRVRIDEVTGRGATSTLLMRTSPDGISLSNEIGMEELQKILGIPQMTQLNLLYLSALKMALETKIKAISDEFDKL